MSTNTDPLAPIDLVGTMMRYESGDLSTLETLELFGYILRSDLAGVLQGSYGRTLASILDNGFLDENGQVTDLAIEWIADNTTEEN